MAVATFSVRMDEDLKNELDELCAQFGMNTSVAINICARAVVRERRICCLGECGAAGISKSS